MLNVWNQVHSEIQKDKISKPCRRNSFEDDLQGAREGFPHLTVSKNGKTPQNGRWPPQNELGGFCMEKDKIISFSKQKKEKIEKSLHNHDYELDFFTKHIMALFNYIACECNKRGFKFILSVTLDEKEPLFVSQSNDPDYIKSIFPEEE